MEQLSENRFSKRVRRQIVLDYCSRHDGEFDAEGFFQEVRKQGPKHAAYRWFEWDLAAAAYEHNVSLARRFVSDLRITIRMEEVRGRSVRIREVEAPMLISPSSGWREGGGYKLVDGNDPLSMALLCGQAAVSLRSFIERYSAALLHAGITPEAVDKVAAALDEHGPPPAHIAAPGQTAQPGKDR